MSGDLEQEYFADGVVEDVITALSRLNHYSSSVETHRSLIKGGLSMRSRSDES
jgi:TolB-like protein